MVPLRKAIALTGLTGNTLRKYADSGVIPSVRTPSGQRLFDVEAWLQGNRPSATIGYCRVDSTVQRVELDNQVECIRQIYPYAEIIQDIGSGLSFKRPGLRNMLERLLRGERLLVLQTQADRLASVGAEAIRFLIEKNGGEIRVLGPPVANGEAELAEIVALIHEWYGQKGSAMSPRQALKKLWEMVDG
jgi:predicted site-specific integrase-resolvase